MRKGHLLVLKGGGIIQSLVLKQIQLNSRRIARYNTADKYYYTTTKPHNFDSPWKLAYTYMNSGSITEYVRINNGLRIIGG